jgi:hypothetical protein
MWVRRMIREKEGFIVESILAGDVRRLELGCVYHRDGSAQSRKTSA